MQPVSAATYRSDGMTWLTGKKQRPRLDSLPHAVVAEANAHGAGRHLKASVTTPISGPAELCFDETAVEVLENCGVVTLIVTRFGGTLGQCSCEYASADISATQGEKCDYMYDCDVGLRVRLRGMTACTTSYLCQLDCVCSSMMYVRIASVHLIFMLIPLSS